MAEVLTPMHPEVRKATEALLLRARPKPDEVEKLKLPPGVKAADPPFPRAFTPAEVNDVIHRLATAAPGISATTSVVLAIGGVLTSWPQDNINYPWLYSHAVWGGPVAIAYAVGSMSTAYDNWAPFFQNVTSCHLQGFGTGWLQVNWFGNGQLLGQFNGYATGIGIFEAGGAGKWARN